jgi:hypothetical protein
LKRNRLVGLLAFIIFTIGIVTYAFPFAQISIYQRFTYKPDPVIVESYAQKIEAFQQSTAQENNSTVAASLNAIMTMYEKSWDLDGDVLYLDGSTLKVMYSHLENAQNKLLNLTLQPHYSVETRVYLLTSIENLISLQKEVTAVMQTNWQTRSTLHTVAHNLYTAYYASFKQFHSFYEQALQDDVAKK